MKKIFTIIALVALSLTAFAQQKKVAVYVTGEQTGINKVLGDKLVEAFAKSGKYIAVERTASFLAELGKEQNYQSKGAVSDAEIARLGIQFGVQYVCVADISDVFDMKYVSTRLIDVEKAEIVNASNADSKLDNMPELLKVTEQLAKELTAKTVQEKAAEIAAMQKANEDTEKMLSEAFTKGYMKVENLYVTTSSNEMKWSDVSKATEDCRLGGLSGWRLPTYSEILMIRSACIRYYEEAANREKYPNLTELYMRKFESVCYRFSYYWVVNQYVVYSGDYYKGGNNNTCKLLLVHDIK